MSDAKKPDPEQPPIDLGEVVRKMAAMIERQSEMISQLTSAQIESAKRVSDLQPRPNDATIETMESITIDAGKKKKRRRGVPLQSTGPIARVAKKLDVSVAEVARRLGENYQSVRTWDSRNTVPDDVQIKLDALLAKTPKPAR